jgi:hypothetical protein
VNSEKYIGLDVHQATIVVAVMDSTGKLVMESILETEAATILQFFAGLRGTLSVTFEEGTWSAWLYDLLNPHVTQLVVCNPRKNALLRAPNKTSIPAALVPFIATSRIPSQLLSGGCRGKKMHTEMVASRAAFACGHNVALNCSHCCFCCAINAINRRSFLRLSN